MVNEEYMQPEFEKLKENSSLIILSFSTNESIKKQNDAIAGISYVSDKSSSK